MSIRVLLEFRDDRDPIDVSIEAYLHLDDVWVGDAIARFYAVCSCGIQHVIDTGTALSAAMVGADVPCAAREPS